MRTLLSLSLLFFFCCRSAAQDQDVLQIGQPLATTVQLPTFGVSFDAEGVLQLKAFRDPNGVVAAQRLAAARAALPGNLARPAQARKVSLARLEAALSEALRDGEPSDAMRKLAGLTRVTSAFCYPESNDIVLVGPAEPWVDDPSGRTVGMVSGRPTLLLKDLAAALRAYRPETDHRAFVGCTISPRAEGLARLVQFQRTIPKRVTQNQRPQVTRHVAQGVRESLGMADVRVFGISPRTHFARIMIEADYRMKRIAIGVENPPVRMTTFAAALKTARTGALERWWFTPSYDGVVTAPDELGMRISGQGVQLQTENKDVLGDGTIVDAGHKPTRATLAFATSFTQRYDDIAAASPVYAQLRQLTDFLIVAAYMRQRQWYERADWDAGVLLNEKSYSIETLEQPLTAPVVVNTFWKQNRMFSPAGGGVSIVAEEAIEKAEMDGALAEIRLDQGPQGDHWWWD